ncbi:Sugar kinase of the NBD/HSP70 family, may contain an N-terminal HTH domain [Actinokineospora alba]|uniref:Sugar kinase of the NBD/HSP70 family, may contain an N-terminal HTH domain n=1 Tax=Actinokineospora alba TaxID=504798 RepID=A0A1H0G2W5_9PSEU|nr:ROK family transcriptional regulator [Actinokineospora alba]TDP69735.1 putative NBD/HSP70 family sugar kinase [Actinokineospora alba]SDI09868.1 Sugar kinase of the NBD/HSP70 family, may contain an N-terminal HTH domain [Actinokineospora alba]SDO01174.1 Sugar kinase of the NBD/HSP70 family, may contain an N-terminal HTH domain [Actinokineospora alba]
MLEHPATTAEKSADQSDIRRHNLSVVLRSLRDGGPNTRAKIADETGLTKAAMSSLVAELADRGLVREGQYEQTGYTGRPGRAYQVDGHVYGIGVEINVDYVSTIALDLAGDVRDNRRLPLDTKATTPDDVLDTVAALLRQTLRATALRGCRPIGITVAAPGVVNHAQGLVQYASNLGWRDVAVTAGLAKRLRGHRIPIQVDNDVKLSAIAEWASGVAAGTPDLAYLSGETGVGAGFLSDGRIVRGTRGFSGEIGHLPLDPDLRECTCGRRGCWETIVSLTHLLRLAADPGDEVHDPRRDIDDRLTELRRRAEHGDRRTLDALDTIAGNLGLGASVLINMVNPAVLVLGGYFAALGDFLLDGVNREVDSRVVAPDLGGCRIELSTLGFAAACRGGAHVALERVLADPTVVPARVG